MRNVLLVSDFDTRGSGYTNIMGVLGDELTRDFKVIGLGISYDYRQHPYKFGITNLQVNQLGGIIDVVNRHFPLSAMVVGLDIPLQNMIINGMKVPTGTKHIGIFAVESDPLIAPAASILSRIDSRFTISQFGADECHKAGLEAQHLPIPLDTNVWYPRTADEQKALKVQLGMEDKIIFFHNADANERKNTGVLVEAFAEVYNQDKRARLVIVTRKNVPHGWDLEELSFRYGLPGKIRVFERGMPVNELRALYAAADCVVNPSKAEGLGMVVLEAQSVGVPVMGTNCTGMMENLGDGKGILIPHKFLYTDPFLNGNRYMVDRNELAGIMIDFMKNITNNPSHYSDMVQRGFENVSFRTVSGMGDLIRGAING